MIKNNNAVKKCKEEADDFDFSDMMESSYDDEMMEGVINSFIETSNNQMTLAIELTKVAAAASKDLTEEKVFSLFKKSAEVIADSFPLKSLLQKLPGTN